MKLNGITPAMTAQRRRAAARRHGGFTLVEVLMAITITALVLAACAVALDAALRTYETAQQTTLAGLSVRNVLNQLAREIRTAQNTPDAPIEILNNGRECVFTDAAGNDLTYRYDPDTHQLLFNVNGAAQWHVVLNDVHPASAGDAIFSSAPPMSDKLPAGTVGRLDIRLAIRREGADFPVVVSVVPRNVLYGK